MCLALPARIIELRENELGIADLGGVRKEISLALVEDVQAGDYVIIHAGYALSKLDTTEAEATLRLFAELSEVHSSTDNAP
ncbi:MAG: HypC/HybG/HupF family hydrogenase formation chaperone [Gallionellaceae bacterium]|nr:HypC/HybG/HupF family hydrogenase formation chaperone [Gallionellaceae bacterium]